MKYNWRDHDICDIPNNKYKYLFEKYPELAESWTNPETHKKFWNGKYTKDGYKQQQHYLKIKCSVCGKYHDSIFGEGWVRWQPNLREQYENHGSYIGNSCRDGKAIAEKINNTLGEDGLRARRIKQLENSGGWAEAGANTYRTRMERYGTIWTEDSRKKACESSNKRREERGDVWANESDWEQQIAKEFGGECGLNIYFEYDKKRRWPDIVFQDGHVIQIDDKSHRKKSLDYEQEYDKACLQKYGKRPLHMMLPHTGAPRRERFDTWRDVVTAYLNDELQDDEFILLDDPWYPKGIVYTI